MLGDVVVVVAIEELEEGVYLFGLQNWLLLYLNWLLIILFCRNLIFIWCRTVLLVKHTLF